MKFEIHSVNLRIDVESTEILEVPISVAKAKFVKDNVIIVNVYIREEYLLEDFSDLVL